MALFKDILAGMLIINKHLTDEEKENETVATSHDGLFLPFVPLEKLTQEEKKKLDELGFMTQFEADCFAAFI